MTEFCLEQYVGDSRTEDAIEVEKAATVLSCLVSYIYKDKPPEYKDNQLKIISKAIGSEEEEGTTTVTQKWPEQVVRGSEETLTFVQMTFQTQVTYKIGQLRRRYSHGRAGCRPYVTEKMDHSINSIVDATKQAILGALNAEAASNRMSDLLTVPLVILHGAPVCGYVIPSEAAQSCLLCGADIPVRSDKEKVCLLCEAQAFILFSNALALTNPSQRSSATQIKLHEVLIQAGHDCIVPEWSSLQSMETPPLLPEDTVVCPCNFCRLLIEDRDVDSFFLTDTSSCASLLSLLLDSNTELFNAIKHFIGDLKFFKRSRKLTGQVHWNDPPTPDAIERQEKLLFVIVRHFIPSIVTVSLVSTCEKIKTSDFVPTGKHSINFNFVTRSRKVELTRA